MKPSKPEFDKPISERKHRAVTMKVNGGMLWLLLPPPLIHFEPEMPACMATIAKFGNAPPLLNEIVTLPDQRRRGCAMKLLTEIVRAYGRQLGAGWMSESGVALGRAYESKNGEMPLWMYAANPIPDDDTTRVTQNLEQVVADMSMIR